MAIKRDVMIELGTKVKGSTIGNISTLKAGVAGLGIAAGMAAAKIVQLGVDLAKTATIAAVNWSTEAANAAGKLEKAADFFQAGFSTYIDDSNEALTAQNKLLTEYAKKIGAADEEILKLTGSAYDLLGPIGLTGRELADTSFDLVQLSEDLASGNPLIRDASEAMEGLKKTLTGSARYAKEKFGIADFAQQFEKAVNSLEESTGRVATEAEKVKIRFDILKEGTKSLAGAAERDGQDWANVVDRIGNRYDTLKAKIGTFVAEGMTPLIESVSDFIDQNSEVIQEGFGLVFEEMFRAVSGVEKSLEDITEQDIRGFFEEFAAVVRVLGITFWETHDAIRATLNIAQELYSYYDDNRWVLKPLLRGVSPGLVSGMDLIEGGVGWVGSEAENIREEREDLKRWDRQRRIGRDDVDLDTMGKNLIGKIKSDIKTSVEDNIPTEEIKDMIKEKLGASEIADSKIMEMFGETIDTMQRQKEQLMKQASERVKDNDIGFINDILNYFWDAETQKEEKKVQTFKTSLSVGGF